MNGYYKKFISRLPPTIRNSSPKDSARYLWYKCRWAFFAGLLFKVSNWRSVRFPFFKNFGCRIWYPEQFRSGQYVYLGRMSHISALSRFGITLGRRVTIGDFSWIQGTSHLSNPGHSLTIADNVYIGPFAIIGFHGPIHIGTHTAIGAGCHFIAQSHDLGSTVTIAEDTIPSKGIKIGAYCWFGDGIKVLDGVEIGDYAVIGAGAVVTKSIPAGSIAVGVPARVIKKRVL